MMAVRAKEEKLIQNLFQYTSKQQQWGWKGVGENNMTWFTANIGVEEEKGFSNDNCLDLVTEGMMIHALEY